MSIELSMIFFVFKMFCIYYDIRYTHFVKLSQSQHILSHHVGAVPDFLQFLGQRCHREWHPSG